ncbi:MAG: FeoA family protein [Desulfovibrio sp.]
MKELKTLDCTRQGSSAVIVSVNSTQKERLRLEGLGVTPGVEIDVLSHSSGILLLGAGEGRFVLEKQVASLIQVL